MSESRIVVALDFAEANDALAFVKHLRPAECRVKVGLELFTHAGPPLVSTLVDQGFDVFLDLKYHDIPTTVSRACTAAARLGVWMLNVHALGGRRMLEAAREAIEGAQRRPLLIGVTMLTSHAQEEMTQLGLIGPIADHVERLAGETQAAGLDGVVCAATEVIRLRARFGDGFKLVTPGIRPAGAAAEDQRRTMTPREAVQAGADYLVIGRPITRADDPQAVLRSVQEELSARA